MKTRLLVSALAVALLAGPIGPATSEPAPPVRLDEACPREVVPLAEFGDVDPANIHAPAIDCLAFWGVSAGQDGDFDPDAPLTQREFDMWLSRVPGIAAEAAAMVTPATAAKAVTKEQVASVLVRVVEARSGEELHEPTPRFADLTSSPHWEAVAKAAGAGVVPPATHDEYRPTVELTRAEGATYLARAMAVLVEDGTLQTPTAPAFEVPPGRAPYLPLPSADSGDYHLDVEMRSDGTPIRFNPCRPIQVVANLDGAHPGAEQALVTALEHLSEAMGTDWVYEGTTDEQLSSGHAGRSAYQPSRYGQRWAPVLVTWPESWVNPMEIALAGSRAVDGAELATGEVRINREAELHGSELTEVLMHELAHVAGLGHVDGTDQMMRRTLQDGSTGPAFEDGDLAALALVGKASGCFRSANPG